MAAVAVNAPFPENKNSGIPRISKIELSAKVESIIDNLKTMKQLNILDELHINVISIIVGSFVGKTDFDNPSPQYPVPRNHECPAFVKNLLQNPHTQISPAFLEHMRQQKKTTLNINQYIFLFDPMYSHKDNEIPYGLEAVFPSVIHNPIIAMDGFIRDDELLPTPIKYNSFLEPHIVPHSVDEPFINGIIEHFQSLGNGSVLINVMDCTSNTLRKLWAQNSAPNVYLAIPDCLAQDNLPMYMPVITYSSANHTHSSDSGEQTNDYRWINWTLDGDMSSIYQLISPHTYTFLIHNYKRLVLETYFIPICKILSLMRITLEYRIDDTKTIVFSKMSFQDFKNYWINELDNFRSLFISFMDRYYEWNFYKFFDILLENNYFSRESSMQKIFLGYIETHLKQLQTFFPTESIPKFIDDDRQMQLLISTYLNENGIH